ncbi:putative retinal homeobox protein Rx [Sesbania bispinosa]|nr:putative retinal homeobox protein Rx [Sesbania bispinosa]
MIIEVGVVQYWSMAWVFFLWFMSRQENSSSETLWCSGHASLVHRVGVGCPSILPSCSWDILLPPDFWLTPPARETLPPTENTTTGRYPKFETNKD